MTAAQLDTRDTNGAQDQGSQLDDAGRSGALLTPSQGHSVLSGSTTTSTGAITNQKRRASEVSSWDQYCTADKEDNENDASSRSVNQAKPDKPPHQKAPKRGEDQGQSSVNDAQIPAVPRRRNPLLDPLFSDRQTDPTTLSNGSRSTLQDPHNKSTLLDAAVAHVSVLAGPSVPPNDQGKVSIFEDAEQFISVLSHTRSQKPSDTAKSNVSSTESFAPSLPAAECGTDANPASEIRKPDTTSSIPLWERVLKCSGGGEEDDDDDEFDGLSLSSDEEVK